MNTKPHYPCLEKLDSMEFLIRLLLFHFELPALRSLYSFMGKLSKQTKLLSSKLLLTQLFLTYQNRSWCKNSIRNDCSSGLKYLRKPKAELNRIGMSLPSYLIKNHREVVKCCLPACNCVCRLRMKDLHLKEYTLSSLHNQAYSCH